MYQYKSLNYIHHYSIYQSLIINIPTMMYHYSNYSVEYIPLSHSYPHYNTHLSPLLSIFPVSIIQYTIVDDII